MRHPRECDPAAAEAMGDVVTVPSRRILAQRAAGPAHAPRRTEVAASVHPIEDGVEAERAAVPGSGSATAVDVSEPCASPVLAVIVIVAAE